MGLEAWKAFLNEETKAPMETTTALLMKILEDNKDTVYGKEYGFADIHSIEEYQQRVPVITYDNVAPYIERMAKGEKNVLTAYPCGHFNETSGTVGVPKMIPMTNKQSDVFAKYNNLLMYGIMRDNLDIDWMDGRGFCTSSGNCKTLESGMTVGEASAKMADYIKGGSDALDQMIRTLYTSPIEGLNPAPGADTKYIHTRFALMDRNVRGIVTSFYSVLVLFLRYIADNYELLIDDIEKGAISKEIEMPDSVRESLLKKIEPMPERAAELREIFKNGSDFPFVRKIWPHFCYFTGAGGDGFEIYDKMLKEYFTGGGVSNIYSGITASEGLWSVPSGVDDFNSIVAPGAAFVEFLPVEAGSDFSQCVTLDKLEVGKNLRADHHESERLLPLPHERRGAGDRLCEQNAHGAVHVPREPHDQPGRGKNHGESAADRHGGHGRGDGLHAGGFQRLPQHRRGSEPLRFPDRAHEGDHPIRYAGAEGKRVQKPLQGQSCLLRLLRGQLARQAGGLFPPAGNFASLPRHDGVPRLVPQSAQAGARHHERAPAQLLLRPAAGGRRSGQGGREMILLIPC